MAIRVVIALVIVFSTFPSSASTKKKPANSTVAFTYAADAIAALTGGNAINDVTLTGNVTWIVGSDEETGSATLLALGTAESRMDLVLSSGTMTEIRDAQTGTQLGEWISPSSTSGMFPFHNCQTDAVWFFPALSSLVAGPNIVFSYVALETRSNQAVQHIRSYVYQPSDNIAPTGLSFQQLSTLDFYLDATTFLPASITFNTHPDNNAALNLPVEIDFSNYQTVNGITVPMHVQKYLQGMLLLDMTLSSATFNTGLSLSTFAIK